MEAAGSLTVADYAALEASSDTKHEYVHGQIFAMAGASVRHNAIAMNLAGNLFQTLRGTGCRPYGSDQRVHVVATDLDTYPDLTIVCGEPERSPDDPHAIVNPSVIVEILSPSTESHDRGTKWRHYQRIASLREYVLVSTDGAVVERFSREAGEEGRWRYDVIEGAGTAMRLSSCAGVLSIDEIYAGLPEA